MVGSAVLAEDPPRTMRCCKRSAGSTSLRPRFGVAPALRSRGSAKRGAGLFSWRSARGGNGT